ncbi:isoprenylcysteine carboxyl methyltransferase family protein [Clostridiales bacterium oral taxon 876 str. F0540]|nr:isoprenylcysteine carboxyl methyltransferase family protein [Clostridiales bacterium oral taxon 876 str. F0540]
MTSTIIITICIWIIFWIYWIISALRTRIKVKKEVAGQKSVQRFVHLFLVVISYFITFYKFNNNFFWNRIIPANLLVDDIGLVILILSLSFGIWARNVLGRNWSGAIQKVEGQRLITHGPYKYIRNPIYTAIVCGFCGTFLVLGRFSSLIGLLIITITYVIKIRNEQKFLLLEFEEEYSNYIKKSWALIPFIF